MMHGHEKSDLAIVAGKPPNKAEQPAPERSDAKLNSSELVERRARTEGNAGQQSTRRTQSRESVSQALERIRKVARERKKERFTALFHHISIDLLERSFFELQEDAAPGVDRLTWKDYEADLERKQVSFILAAYSRSFFDDISQDWLIRFLEHRIGDRRIIRLIQKWLKAGILEDGVVAVSDRGTGQGSVISPLLANIYLHYSLDLWAVRWRRREATGDMIIVRYADDFIIGFEHESDARRFLDEMRERLGKFALTLHPEKTRLIEFGRFAAERRKRRGLGKPETFNFLGFTFICGKTRQGKFQIKRKTRRDRMQAKLKMVQQEMRRRMHQPIAVQGKWLWYVVNGYFNYHAVPTNSKALVAFRTEIARRWRRVLIRRSERTKLNWKQMQRLVDDWLPKPRILHPWPNKRFAVRYLR